MDNDIAFLDNLDHADDDDLAFLELTGGDDELFHFNDDDAPQGFSGHLHLENFQFEDWD